MREEKLSMASQLGTASESVRPPERSGVANASPTEQTSAAGRFAALDLLRFLAVVLMVQGHTFREVLELAVREERWHGYHNYIHGYTAPIFLFSSGLAFGITTFRSWEKHLSFGQTLLKRFERYALIILIGYAIHLPQLSLTSLLTMPEPRLSVILKVDALQNIGVTLAVAELAVVALRTPRRFVALTAGLGALLVLIAPAVWRLDVSEIPIFFAAYVNTNTGSIFPLAPWASFLLVGILTGYALWDPDRRTVRENAHIGLFVVGAITIFLGDRLAHADLDHLFGEHNFWKTSPFFFLIRIGVVWVLLSALILVGRMLTRRSLAAKGGLVQTLGQETLVIYVAHLFVLYGSPMNPGVVPRVGATLSVGESTLLFVAIFTSMIALALVWHFVKTRFTKSFDLLRRAVAIGMILVFVLS